MQTFKDVVAEHNSPEYQERIRTANYEGLVKLAEYLGFSKNSVEVSVANPQPPEYISQGKLALDMRMPAELLEKLKEIGFFKGVQ